MSTFNKLGLLAGSLVLVFSLLLLAGGGPALAAENNFDELTTLSVKIEGVYEEEAAEFWYRLKHIGTDQEIFRLDVTTLETDQQMAIILDQRSDEVFIKQMGAPSWQQLPAMTLSKWWKQYRDSIIASYGGADFWYGLEEDDKEEYLLEGEEDGEEYTVTVYDIDVDEPIDDSVFSPDGS